MTDITQMAVEVFDRCAAQYQDKFMDISLYKDSFDLFCSNVRPGAAILEIACGPGNITKYLLEKRPDFQLLGIDLSPNMLRLAALNNPAAAFRLMDAKDIGSIGKMYDAIMCGFCLPYLSKEELNKLIADACSILTANGIFYMSTMEDHYSKSGLQQTAAGNQLYMYYYEAADLTAMLAAHHFHVIAMDRKVYPGPDGTTITDLWIIAGK
ncbi:class I SAM-dependent methyltransferase [Chitinophaga sp. 22321]|uniref:Class I SAM-dependent methyltransferase n=1 Tax=Chitinophaga hostae TaxID=2831022 RepID=A0ABS5J604_9BACT|nr:class I SAM-dependent methyltransferase [Chitinophaga hostae]MBS0030614.1 class I SAM-dependent methyltransferase [Chitinophaga hostae]